MILDATAPHTRIDNFVIDDYGDKIGAYGLAVYLVIKRHYNWTTGQCTPSYNRIAEMIKVSRSTVKRTVKSLKAIGIIDPQMRFTDDGQTSNQYEFCQPERPKKQAPEKPGASKKSVQTGTSTQMSNIPPPGSVGPPPGVCKNPNQIDLNKREKRRNAKSVPSKEKELNCRHPEREIIRLHNGITICTDCYTLLL